MEKSMHRLMTVRTKKDLRELLVYHGSRGREGMIDMFEVVIEEINALKRQVNALEKDIAQTK